MRAGLRPGLRLARGARAGRLQGQDVQADKGGAAAGNARPNCSQTGPIPWGGGGAGFFSMGPDLFRGRGTQARRWRPAVRIGMVSLCRKDGLSNRSRLAAQKYFRRGRLSRGRAASAPGRVPTRTTTTMSGRRPPKTSQVLARQAMLVGPCWGLRGKVALGLGVVILLGVGWRLRRRGTDAKRTSDRGDEATGKGREAATRR